MLESLQSDDRVEIIVHRHTARTRFRVSAPYIAGAVLKMETEASLGRQFIFTVERLAASISTAEGFPK